MCRVTRFSSIASNFLFCFYSAVRESYSTARTHLRSEQNADVRNKQYPAARRRHQVRRLRLWPLLHRRLRKLQCRFLMHSAVANFQAVELWSSGSQIATVIRIKDMRIAA